MYGNLVPWTRGGGYDVDNDMNNKYTDWVGIDVDGLDLNLHKYLTEAEFQIINQFPGDCIFLPYSMLHYAGHITNDTSKLQVAVSYMWLPGTRFNPDCPSNVHNIPLAVFDTVWYYSGYGAIPQGQYDPLKLAFDLLYESSSFRPQSILEYLPSYASANHPGIAYVLETLEAIAILVRNGKQVPLDLWLHLSTAADMNRLGCNENVTYIDRPFSEINRMLETVVR
jgi:hypothetical protein